MQGRKTFRVTEPRNCPPYRGQISDDISVVDRLMDLDDGTSDHRLVINNLISYFLNYYVNKSGLSCFMRHTPVGSLVT